MLQQVPVLLRMQWTTPWELVQLMRQQVLARPKTLLTMPWELVQPMQHLEPVLSRTPLIAQLAVELNQQSMLQPMQ